LRFCRIRRKKQRADERTRTADRLITSVCGRWLLGSAEACNHRITTRFFVARIATIVGYCVRVRVKWYPKAVDCALPVPSCSILLWSLVRIDRTLAPKVNQRCKPDVRATARVVRSPPIRFHDLRYSCLFLLAQDGEPIRVLQALASHATAAIPLLRYTQHYEACAWRTAEGTDEALG
jgi:hypothetical protein